VDCVPCFGAEIAILSLGSAAEMQLTHARTGAKQALYLQVGSLLILKDEARYDWKHAIPARKSDFVHGLKFPRGRRLSVTFRSVIVG
jgi:alkylated DNA repair dioxygenase AlkB